MNCPNCDIALVYSRKTGYYFCTTCFDIFFKKEDEIVPVTEQKIIETVVGGSVCRYNNEVNCCEYNMRIGKCDKCGWNPRVTKYRKEKINNK